MYASAPIPLLFTLTHRGVFKVGISFSRSLPVVAIALNVGRISNLWHRYLWAARIPPDVKLRVLKDHKLASNVPLMGSPSEPSISKLSASSSSYQEEDYGNYLSDTETLFRESSWRTLPGVSAFKTFKVGIDSSRRGDPEIGIDRGL